MFSFNRIVFLLPCLRRLFLFMSHIVSRHCSLEVGILPSGENIVVSKRLLLSGGLNHSVDERSLLLAGAVQISKMAADGAEVCGGCARHQLALSFRGCGLMHDDTDFLPSLDSATPPECSIKEKRTWRSV